MSVATQALAPFKLSTFMVILSLIMGAYNPVHAGSDNPHIVYVFPKEGGGGGGSDTGDLLANAQKAIDDQKALIEALREKVKELESELANCKGQKQDVVPQKP